MRGAVAAKDVREDEVLFPDPPAQASGASGQAPLGLPAGFAVAGAIGGFVLGALLAPFLARLLNHAIPDRVFHALFVIAGGVGGWALWEEVLAGRAFRREQAKLPAGPPPAVSVAPLGPVDPSRCPYCHEPTQAQGEEPRRVCHKCGAWQHEGCWAEHVGCAACGDGVPPAEEEDDDAEAPEQPAEVPAEPAPPPREPAG